MTTVSRRQLDRWHKLILQRDGQDLLAMLAEDVVFRSPFQWRPYHGREVVWLLLVAAIDVLEGFAYHRELMDGNNWALEFSAQVGDLALKGIDLIRLNDDGLIVEIEVFVRPANGLQALGAAIFRRLGSPPPA